MTARPEPRPCAGCTMCCMLIGVAELKKPPNVWCHHCAKGAGCRIQGRPERPQVCADFFCLWALSGESGLGEELRPDRSRVVLGATKDGKRLVAYVHPHFPNAHLTGPMAKFLAAANRKGLDVIAVIGKRRVLLPAPGTNPSTFKIEVGDAEMLIHSEPPTGDRP